MLTQTALRRLGVATGGRRDSICGGTSPLTERCTAATDTVTPEVHPAGESAVSGSLPLKTLSSRRFIVIIDLNSVMREIAAERASEARVWACATEEGASTPAPSVHSPSRIAGRVEGFFAAVEEQLLRPGLITVNFVLGDLAEVAGEDASTAPVVAPDYSDSTTSAYQSRARGESDVSVTMADYLYWYRVLFRALETVERFGQRSALFTSSDSGGLSVALRLLASYQASSQSQWLASSSRSKAVGVIPGGLPAVCVCSSDPAAYFLPAPLDSVITDLYAVLCKGGAGSLTVTHGAGAAFALGGARLVSTLLPTLYATLQAGDELLSSADAATTVPRTAWASPQSPAEWDRLLDALVDLVVLHHGHTGECFCEQVLALLRQPAVAAPGEASHDGGPDAPARDDALVLPFLLLTARRRETLLPSTNDVLTGGGAVPLVSEDVVRVARSILAFPLPRWVGLAVSAARGLSGDVPAGVWPSGALLGGDPLLPAAAPRASGAVCLVGRTTKALRAMRAAMTARVAALVRGGMGGAPPAPPLGVASATDESAAGCAASASVGHPSPTRARSIRDLLVLDSPTAAVPSPRDCSASGHDTPPRGLKTPAVVQPLFLTEAAVDAFLWRVPGEAQLVMVSLLFLCRAHILSLVRACVWLLHALRALSDPSGHEVHFSARLEAQLKRQESALVVTCEELVSVQAAMAHVVLASVLCATAPSALVVNAAAATAGGMIAVPRPFFSPAGILAAEDLEAAVVATGSLLPPAARAPDLPLGTTALQGLSTAFAVLGDKADTWAKCVAYMDDSFLDDDVQA